MPQIRKNGITYEMPEKIVLLDSYIFKRLWAPLVGVKLEIKVSNISNNFDIYKAGVLVSFICLEEVAVINWIPYDQFLKLKSFV